MTDKTDAVKNIPQEIPVLTDPNVFKTMPYKELQKYAKLLGLHARKPADEMIAALEATFFPHNHTKTISGHDLPPDSQPPALSPSPPVVHIDKTEKKNMKIKDNFFGGRPFIGFKRARPNSSSGSGNGSDKKEGRVKKSFMNFNLKEFVTRKNRSGSPSFSNSIDHDSAMSFMEKEFYKKAIQSDKIHSSKRSNYSSTSPESMSMESLHESHGSQPPSHAHPHPHAHAYPHPHLHLHPQPYAHQQKHPEKMYPELNKYELEYFTRIQQSAPTKLPMNAYPPMYGLPQYDRYHYSNTYPPQSQAQHHQYPPHPHHPDGANAADYGRAYGRRDEYNYRANDPYVQAVSYEGSPMPLPPNTPHSTYPHENHRHVDHAHVAEEYTADTDKMNEILPPPPKHYSPNIPYERLLYERKGRNNEFEDNESQELRQQPK